MKYPVITSQEAAALIPHGSTIGFSGFTPAGAAKAVPTALAARAKVEHAAGRPFTVRVLTGASTGPSLDGVLAEADAISFRAPYQADSLLRKKINSGQVQFVDAHLSHFPQAVLHGFFGEVDFAVVEATEVTDDGRVYLTTSIGTSPVFLHTAKKVIFEINRRQHPRLREMADILMVPRVGHRTEIRLTHVGSRIGQDFAVVDPAKVIGVVHTDLPDEVSEFTPPDESATRIAGFVSDFLVAEMKAGRVPREFLPLQAGVGNVANAVMASLGASRQIPPFTMFAEVCQDSLVDLIELGRLTMMSTTSLTLSQKRMERLFADIGRYTSKIILRAQEISNNPELIRRLGVIALNTAIEVDIYGHVNSTHVMGTQVMNGIGGSGDFARNSFLSVFMCPSVAKDGAISTVVPMCSHVDHNEHSVSIIVTDQGLADLRGKDPAARAREIIDKCAHPDYREPLRDYLKLAGKGHVAHDLSRAFAMHQQFLKSKTMRGVSFS